MGLWLIPIDFERLSVYFSRDDGWIFTIPIAFAVSDIYLTLIGLSRGNWELNPFVNSAIQIGPWATVPFLISYLALSEGLALAILNIGRKLFGADQSVGYLPFAMTCGAASIGPINNLELLIVSGANSTSLVVAIMIGMTLVAGGVFCHFRRNRSKSIASLF